MTVTYSGPRCQAFVRLGMKKTAVVEVACGTKRVIVWDGAKWRYIRIDVQNEEKPQEAASRALRHALGIHVDKGRLHVAIIRKFSETMAILLRVELSAEEFSFIFQARSNGFQAETLRCLPER